MDETLPDVHVHPCDREQRHTASRHCWCVPWLIGVLCECCDPPEPCGVVVVHREVAVGV